MAEVILMPRLSDTMTEGVIAAWHKKVGDPVKKGDLLAEIETDKATMELESYQEGTVLYLGGNNGSKLQVNDLLAIIGKEGEDVSKLIKENSVTKTTATPEEKPTEVKPETKPAEVANNAPSLDISNMEEVVLMPRLSDTMTEGVIASWQKNVGDDVKKGDVLAEIETDKATMELESYKDGKLLYQGAKTGEKILVNNLLAIIGNDGLNVDAIVAAAKGGNTDAKAEAAFNEAPAKTEAAKTPAPPSSTPAQVQEVLNEGRIFVSPLAKKLADEKGIDLKYVKGSGDNGRIVRTDIENYTPPSAQSQVASTPTSTPSAAPAGQVSFDEVPVSQMRKTIARRLAESKFTAPHFYLTMSINMD
ncbi:biotin/lipoyl-containing protein, partial [Arachidicoccus sp.]|uniref:biotin/lipoyl-containing protein n=1 Tax=Arachidicoccus sp. TaxID=1872624 RepID=UPI003D1FDEDA